MWAKFIDLSPFISNNIRHKEKVTIEKRQYANHKILEQSPLVHHAILHNNHNKNNKNDLSQQHLFTVKLKL